MPPNPKRLPRVYLVRHGETEWSKSGQHTGKTDIPLTENGVNLLKDRAPAYVGTGKLICPKTICRVFVSPRQRAQRTFDLISEASDMPFKNDPNIKVETTEDVAEWDYGDYEGLKTAEIREKNADWWIWTDGCPNGESPQQVRDRVDRVIDKIVHIQTDYIERLKSDSVQHDHPGGDVLIVSHGHFTKCFLVRWAKLAINSGEILVADPGAVHICGVQHHRMEERSLLALNLHSYLLESA